MKSLLTLSATTLAALVCLTASAQLPADFPTLTVTTNYPPAVAPGYIFQGVNLPVQGVGYYAMVVTNDGSPIWYQKLTNACWDFKVLPNGYLHYAQQIKALTYTGGGDVVHQILDENYSPVETIQAGNGYIAEAHDFQMLPNGDVLLFGYYLTQVDMSQVVSNGNPAALVSGAILQELDAQRNVVFQWRSWDYYPFTSDWVNSTATVISEFHFNRVFLDNDANLVVSTPAWVKKISRQTGNIMWHLGGTENEFTFVGVSQATGISDFASHDITRLPNGNVLLYNNSLAGVPGSSSTAKEYSLDETNKIATRIWSYTPDPAVAGPFQGSAQRLANGNTFVGWGGLPGLTTVACTEVSGTNVVFQMKFDNTNVVSYRSFRFPYPPQTQATVAPVYQVANGNSYEFGLTGVSIDVQSGAGGYNILTVNRSPYAPVNPLFQGKAPLVLPARVSMTETSLGSLGATFNFDAQSFALANPTNLTLYYRPTTGQGLFLPQPTSYNPATQKLSATVALTSQGNDLGEFIFGYPDLADVPYPPMMDEVENYRGVQPYDVIAPKLANGEVTYAVNQELPILLSWSPKGFARYYQFQISTNLDFSTTLVSVVYQTQAYYVWNGAAPNTTYYYRAMTVNEGGQSDWSVGSFTTAPPFITLSFPDGGEVLQRGVSYFIRWNDNLAENVNIELYKNGALVTGIATNVPSNGAYQWQPGFGLVPGSDYAIKISSATNSSLSYTSDGPFSIIDPPKINAAALASLPGGQVQFALNVPGATQATVLGSTNLSSWQELQTVPLISGSGMFTDNVLINSPQRFYRVRVP